MYIRTLSKLAPALMGLLMLTGPSQAQEHHRRSHLVQFTNTGQRVHSVRLHDREANQEHSWTLAPGQQQVSTREWNGEGTRVFVDGQRRGRLNEVAHMEEREGSRMWIFDVHGRRRP